MARFLIIFVALVAITPSPAGAVVSEAFLVGSSLAAFFGSAATAAAVVNAAIALTLSAVSFAVQTLLAPSGPSGFGRTSTERQATITTPVRARFFALGRVKAGGHQVFQDVDAIGDLYRILVYSCDPVNSIEHHFINNELVTLDNDGWVQTPAKWLNKIRIVATTGAASQTAFNEMTSAFPNIWTTAHRGDGLAYVMIQQKPVALAAVSETYPNGPRGEEWTAIFQGSDEVYDPRDSSTGYSQNAVLLLMHVLMHEFGGNLALSDFSLTTWQTAANTADTVEIGAGGVSYPRYEAAGFFEATRPDEAVNKLIQTVNDMLINCNGRLYEDPNNGGKLAIALDRPSVLADAPFTSAHLLAVGAAPAESFLQKRDATVAQFVHPDMGFADDITPHYPPSVSAPQNVHTIVLPWTPHWSQAGSIVKFQHELATSSFALTVSLNHVGHLAVAGQGLTFNAVEIDSSGSTEYLIRVLDQGATNEPSFQLQLVEMSAALGVWDGSTEMVEPDIPPASEGGVAIAAPLDICYGSTDGAGNGRLLWDVENSGDQFLFEHEWSETGQNDFGNRQRETLSDGSALLDLTSATGNVDIRSRIVLLTGGVTDWTTITNQDPDGIIPAPTTPGVQGLPSTYELDGQNFMLNQAFDATWTENECVRILRVFVEANVTPPTVQVGSDVEIRDSDEPFTTGTGLVSGLQANDTVYVQIEIENASGNTTKSNVFSISMTNFGGGGA